MDLISVLDIFFLLQEKEMLWKIKAVQKYAM